MASGKEIIQNVLQEDQFNREICRKIGYANLYGAISPKEWDYTLPTLEYVIYDDGYEPDEIKNFKKLFYKQIHLDDFNWDNVVVAGGSISSILNGNSINDIDLFLYHLTPEDADLKVEEIINFIDKKYSIERVVQSKNCITIILDDFNFQIIYRIYQSVSEILYGFDLGSSAVAFNGKNLSFSVLGKFAFEYCANIIDTTRRSKSYEHRIEKYLRRGFNVIMPNFDISKIDIEMKSITLNTMNINISKIDNMKICVGQISNSNNYISDYDDTSIFHHFYNNIYNLIRGRTDNITIPYYHKNIEESILLFYRNLATTIHKGAFPELFINKYIISHTSDELFEIRNYFNKIKIITEINAQLVILRMQKFIKSIGWMTENCGTQLTSSFNPIDEPPEKWYGEYYLSDV